MNQEESKGGQKVDRKERTRRPSQELYRPPSANSAPKTPEETSVIADPRAEAHLDKSDQTKADIEDDSWETMYNDAGDCICRDLVNEFKQSVGISGDTQVKVHALRSDLFEEHLDTELPHVLEVYDFLPQLKTKDIFMSISSSG